MRIAVTAPFWKPPQFKGGISRVIYELRKVWIAQDHIVHIYASMTDEKPADGIFRIPVPPVPLRAVWNSLYLALSGRLMYYDVIFPQSGTECLFLDKTRCIPFIHTLRNVEHKVPWRIWRYSHEFFEKQAMRGLRACFALSEDSIRTLVETYQVPRSAVRKINNGVDYETFRSDGMSRNHPFTILTAGRFIPRKRFDLLIRAFSLFVRDHDDSRLIIAGEGFLEQSLKALASHLGVSNRILFPGYVDEQGMLELYRTADVFALASRAEGMPMVVLEAQSCGLPAVLANFEAAKEVIEHGRTGFIVFSEEPEEWAQTLSLLKSDHVRRHKLSIEARKRVVARFGWDSTAAQIMETFETLV